MRTLPLMLVLVCVLQCGAGARATDLTYQKLYGKWSGADKSNYQMGALALINGHQPNLIAVTEQWIAAGVPFAAEQGAASDGAVQVFNAVTGAHVRKVLPPAPGVASRYFGAACAVAGNLLAVGAPGPSASTSGRAYLYNISTGALIRTFDPVTANGARFGASIAFNGDLLVVGAPTYAGGLGRFYVYNLKTNVVFDGLGEDVGDRLGSCVAIEGGMVAVSAPNHNGDRGAVYLYRSDAVGTVFIRKIVPAVVVAGEHVGLGLAMQGGWLAMGAPYHDSGRGRIHMLRLPTDDVRILAASVPVANQYVGYALSISNGMLMTCCPYEPEKGQAFVFDLAMSAPTTELRQIVQPDQATEVFAPSGALSGNTAVLAISRDNGVALGNGALCLARPITRPLPMEKMLAKGDYAPDVLNATYGATGEFFLNRQNEAGFVINLAGPGSNGGKDSIICSQMGTGDNVRLLKTRAPDGIVPNPTIAALFNPLPNLNDRMVFRARYSGAGVTSYDNQAVYMHTAGGDLTRLFRTGGAPSAIFGGGVPLHFREMRMGRSVGSTPLALTFALRTGVATTTASNDTGLVLYNLALEAGDTTVPREGSAAGLTGVTYGQFTGRVALMGTLTSYTTAAAGAPAFNQALFTKLRTGNETLVARKGDIPTTPGGVPFSGFLGENTDSVGYTSFRATLGPPATTANNEGIWSSFSVPKLLFRKGADLPPPLTGLKIAKFINFRVMFGTTLVQVQLSGPGVTAANDQALLTYQTDPPVGDTINVLMREGDPAPGCSGARIGVISRVETEGMWGQYLVLATLTGVPAGTELALFQGSARVTLATAAEEVRRRPVVVLRKGALYDNQPSKIKSISFSSSQTPSGAGNVGLGRVIQEAINSGEFTSVLLTLDFVNGVRQVMKGAL